MNLKYLLLPVLFAFCVKGVSQNKLDPTMDEIALATDLETELCEKDDEFVIKNSFVNYSFDFERGPKNVVVEINKKNEYICVSESSATWIYEFYDKNSEIIDFSFLDKRDKNSSVYIQDGYYKSNDLFFHDTRLRSASVNFPLKGYIKKWILEKKINDIKYFTSIYFTESFAIKNKSIVIDVPEWLNIEFKELNFDGYDIVKVISKEKNNITRYTYTIKNVSSPKTENSTLGPSHTKPHLLVLAKSHSRLDSDVKIFQNTADLYNWYKTLVDKIEDKPVVFKEFVHKLIEGKDTDKDKIEAIYYWVQDNIRYIAYEDGIAGFKPDESQNVFNNKYGDCKGMANLLKQMLLIAGFDAQLCWIGTNRIAYDYSTPNLAVDNHMICTIKQDGKRYFLDGTEKYNSFGTYANRIQGRQVLIENGDGYLLENIPNGSSNENLEVLNIDYKIEDEKLIGKVTKRLNGESRSQFMYSYNNTESNDRDLKLKKYLSNGDKNVTLTINETSDLNNRNKQMSLNYDVLISNKISEFEGEMYIDLDFYKEFENLDMSERVGTYLLPYKTLYKSNISLLIPEGFQISKKPNNISITTENIEASISYTIQDSKLLCSKIFNFKSGKILKSKLEEWSNYFDELKNNYNRQLILNKHE